MTLANAIAALDITATAITPLHGGSLSDVYLVETPHGPVVAKRGDKVEIEARMLAALLAAGAPVPRVIAHHDTLMVIEYLPETAPDTAAWAGLGQSLRTLHAHESAENGWSDDYAFGSLAMPNTPSVDWPSFWAENRLLPFAAQVPDLAPQLEALCLRLPHLLPPHATSLLHGDLWAGNVHFSGGQGYLIDPACYYGDGEVDLALLHLFGTPPAAFTDAYGALDAGWDVRRAIYALYPALVHLHLFGSGYRALVDRLLDESA